MYSTTEDNMNDTSALIKKPAFRSLRNINPFKYFVFLFGISVTDAQIGTKGTTDRHV